MLELYQTFLTLTRVKSYIETARILSMSQPGVSKRIKKIESMYDIKLFKDTHLNLTDEGEEFLSLAHSVVNTHSNFEKKLHHKKVFKNSIIVAAELSLAFREIFLNDLFLEMKHSLPKEFEITFLESSDYTDSDYNLSKYDYIFSSKTLNIPKYNRIKLYEDTIHIITNANSYVHFVNNIKHRDLIDDNAIFLNKNSLIFSKITTLFEVKKNFFLNNTEHILSLIEEHDLGCTFLPGITYSKFLTKNYPSLKSYCFNEKTSFPVYLYYKDNYRSKAFLSFLNSSLHNYFDN